MPGQDRFPAPAVARSRFASGSSQSTVSARPPFASRPNGRAEQGSPEMNENFPNREAVIVRDQELHVVRRLPQNAEIKVRPGERISSDHVIAKTDPRHLAVRISIADQLGVPPNEVGKYMLRGVG